MGGRGGGRFGGAAVVLAAGSHRHRMVIFMLFLVFDSGFRGLIWMR